MKAPASMTTGATVTVCYSGGHTVETRIVEWCELGIVTESEYHLHFTPYHGIKKVTIEKPGIDLEDPS